MKLLKLLLLTFVCVLVMIANPLLAHAQIPTGLGCASGNAAISLSWTAVTGSGITYNVYRGTTHNGESTTPIKTGLASPTYIDNNGGKGLSNGSPYFYEVTSKSGTAESGKSIEVYCVPSIRINCGDSSSYTDTLNHIWGLDTGSTGGTTSSTTNTITNLFNVDAALYKDWREGNSTTPSFSYSNLPVTNGKYNLKLLFVESEGKTTGQRVFNIAANGTTLYSNLDIYAKAGGANKALLLSSLVTVTSGTFSLNLTAVTGYPLLCGFELVPFTGGGSVIDVPAPGWGGESISSDSPGYSGYGPASALSMIMPSGVEECNSGTDIYAFNPIGSSVSYERTYRSSLAGAGYASPGLSAGWIDNYDLKVYDHSTYYTLVYPNGSTEKWTGHTNPLSTYSGTQGVPYTASETNTGTTINSLSMTMKDRSVYTFTAVSGSTTTFILTKITNVVGHAVTINRTSDNRISSIKNDAGTTLLAFTYDSSNHLNYIVDSAPTTAADQSRVSYVFPSSTAPLASVTQIGAATVVAPTRWSYSYTTLNSQPYLTSVSCPDPSSPTGATTATATVNYDPTGAVTYHSDANTNLHAYVYQPNGSVETDVYSPTNTLSQTWQKNIAPINLGTVDIGSTDAGGNSNRVTYTSTPSIYLPNAFTNKNNQTSTVAYDGVYGNVKQVIDPRGITVTNTYQYPTDFPLGQVITTQVSNPNATLSQAPINYTYYGTSSPFNGLLNTVVTPLPGVTNNSATSSLTTTYTYNNVNVSGKPLGNLLTVQEKATTAGVLLNNYATSRTVTYNYTSASDPSIGYSYSQSETLGEPVSVTVTGEGTPDKLVSYYKYDDRGRTIAEVDALGNETDYKYDLGDNLVQVTFPATNSATPTKRATEVYQYAYIDGPLVSVGVYDESGNLYRQVTYAYGHEGELLSETDLTGLVDGYAYDPYFRISAVEDGKANVTQYFYDAIGNLTQIAYPLHSGAKDLLNYSYDSDNNLISEVDGNSNSKTYGRDPIDSRLTGVTYSKNAADNLAFYYDNFERVNKVTKGPTTTPTLTTISVFDDLSDLTSNTYSFAGGPSNQVISYTYFADGSRDTMSTPLSATNPYDYDYDGLGRLTQVVFPWSGGFWSYAYEKNGWLERSQGPRSSTEYTYNARGFLTSLQNLTIPGNRLTSAFRNMTYDAVGNRLSAVCQVPAQGLAPDASRMLTFAYDKRDQLTQDMSAPELTTDPYKAKFNYGFAYDLASNPTTFRSSTLSFNSDNQLSGNTFDGNGNPTTYQSATFGYDSEDRLTSILAPSFSAIYDADGMRAEKTVAAGTTYYLYDGSDPVIEEKSTGAVTAANGYGLDGIRERYYPGSLMLGSPAKEYGKQYYFYSFDPQGNLVQRQSQNNYTTDALDTAVYDSYGALTRGGVSADFDTLSGKAEVYSDPVGFGGQYGYYTDPETKLVLCGHRYYDAGPGRWLNRDPIGYAGGINLYGFAGNNPVNEIDPEGTNSFGDWLHKLIFGTVKPDQPTLADAADNSAALDPQDIDAAVSPLNQDPVAASSVVRAESTAAAVGLTTTIAGPEEGTALKGEEVIIDSSALTAHGRNLSSILKIGEIPVITKTILAELRNVAIRAGKGITGGAKGIRVVEDVTDVEDAIKIRQMVKGDKLRPPGLFGDGRIADTAIKTGRTLITADRQLYETVIKLGGKARLVAGSR